MGKQRDLTTAIRRYGALTHASACRREVAVAALRRNASGVMLAHKHPSGRPEPSAADLSLTEALPLLDVHALDHFVVAGTQVHPFAAHGQL